MLLVKFNRCPPRKMRPCEKCNGVDLPEYPPLNIFKVPERPEITAVVYQARDYSRQRIYFLPFHSLYKILSFISDRQTFPRSVDARS